MPQPQPQPPARERGSSTAEFAVILPALVFVLGLVLGAAAVGMVQLRLEESARLGARAAARGRYCPDGAEYRAGGATGC